MKNKDELEKIAGEIIERMDTEIYALEYTKLDKGLAAELIVSALSKVQDEALNSVQQFPKLLDTLLAKYESLDPPQSEKAMKEMWAIEDQIKKLRANMKPVDPLFKAQIITSWEEPLVTVKDDIATINQDCTVELEALDAAPKPLERLSDKGDGIMFILARQWAGSNENIHLESPITSFQAGFRAAEERLLGKEKK